MKNINTNKGKSRINTLSGRRYIRMQSKRKRVATFCSIMIFIFVLGVAEFTKDIGTALKVQVDKVVAIEEVVITEPTPTPTPEPTEGWEEFVVAVEKVAPIYNFPKNVVLAQGALESAHGNSTFARERNNYLGIGAYDSDPGQAFHFENAEQCVIEYMRIIKRNFPEAWAQRDNPEGLLHALKVNKNGKMYATDKNYEAKVKSMKEWGK